MKNFSFVAVLLIALTILSTSCYSSRKNGGCPGNPQGSYKFKG